MTKTPKARKSAETQSQKHVANPAQYKRFREFSREHGADGDKETFDKTFEALIKKANSK